MKNKYIAGAVSFIAPIFLLAFSFISIIPAQTAFAQTTTPVTCPTGFTCTYAAPTISSISPNPISVGQTLTIVGQNIYTPNQAMSIYIDGAALTTGFTVLSNNTTAYFTLPQLTDGTHTLNFVNGNGTSNILNFQVQNTSTIPPTPSSDAVTKIVGTPTLTLSYDSAHKESALVATFNVSVYGGTTGVNIYKNGAATTFYLQPKNLPYNTNSESTVITTSPQIKTTVDSNGNSLFVVPAGKTYIFKVVSAVNPGDLFAGSYIASLEQAFYAVVGVNANNQFKLAIPKNNTNQVTIVGEITPYISSVTSPALAGKPFTIMGQRLYGVGGPGGHSALLVDGKTFSPSSFSKDGTSINTTLPSSFVVGSTHTVAVKNTLNGTSNIVSFQVSDPTVLTNNATVVVSGTPTLALTYDSTQKESALTATFNVTVTAGNTDLYLQTSMANVGLFDQNGNYAPANSIQVNVNAGEKSDYYGRNYTILSPGTSVQMTIVLGANPGQLFAGSYYASLVNLYSYNGSPMDPNVTLGSIIPLKNQTNSKTIVGELSPYITSITNPAVQGQAVTVGGQRLSNSTVLVDGALVNAAVTAATNGSSLNFILPTTVSVGTHYLTLNNPITGLSNGITLNVLAGSSTPLVNINATLDSSSPVTGMVQTNSSTQTAGIYLGVFDIKSSANAVLKTLTVNVTSTASIASTFANVQLKQGSTLIATGVIANSSSNSSAVTFSNLNVSLPTNLYVPVSVVATVNAGVNGSSAYVSLPVSATNIYAIDTASLQVGVVGSGTLTGSTQTFLSGAQALSNLSWSITAPQTTSAGLSPTTTFNGSFTVTAGTAAVYIPYSPNNAFTLGANTSSVSGVIKNFVPSNGMQSYDMSGLYYQITPGSSRTFTLAGTMTNNNPSSQSAGVGITSINFAGNSTFTKSTPVTTLIQGLNSDFHGQVLLGAGSGANVSNFVSIIAPAQSTANGLAKTTTFSASFTITAGSAPIYISNKYGAALNLVSNSINVVAAGTNFAPSNGTQSYDTTGTYQIVPGSSRTFTITGTLTNSGAGTVSAGAGITAINISSTASLSSITPITANLQGLNSDFHLQTLLGGSGTIAPGSSASYNSTSAPGQKTANVWDALTNWFSTFFSR